MKLAEALSLRADLQKRIAQMDGRLKASCKVQEGDIPPENPEDLLKELNGYYDQLKALIIKINNTNQAAILSDGKTLTERIADRDVLKMQVKELQDLLAYLSERPDRYTRQEIKYVCTVDLADLRRKADDCSKTLRLVDVEIQAANWTFDLVE